MILLLTSRVDRRLGPLPPTPPAPKKNLNQLSLLLSSFFWVFRIFFGFFPLIHIKGYLGIQVFSVPKSKFRESGGLG